MGDRVIDFSDRAAYLSVNNSLLVIRFPAASARPQGRRWRWGRGDERTNAEPPGRAEVHTVPLEEIAVVVVSHPQVTYSHAVLPGLAAAGGILIACDAKHLPAAMMLPLVTHSTQTERFAAQAKVSLPTCKRAWQQIVKAKLEAQAQLLQFRRRRMISVCARSPPRSVPATRRTWRRVAPASTGGRFLVMSSAATGMRRT